MTHDLWWSVILRMPHDKFPHGQFLDYASSDILYRQADSRRPLIEDCANILVAQWRTVHHIMTHIVSFMMHNDAQCDFGNFEALLWQIFEYQKYDLENLFPSFYYMNDAYCTMMHSASLCDHNVGSPLSREDACSQQAGVFYRLTCYTASIYVDRYFSPENKMTCRFRRYLICKF